MVVGQGKGDDCGGGCGQGQGASLLFGGVMAGDGLEGDCRNFGFLEELILQGDIIDVEDSLGRE